MSSLERTLSNYGKPVCVSMVKCNNPENHQPRDIKGELLLSYITSDKEHFAVATGGIYPVIKNDTTEYFYTVRGTISHSQPLPYVNI